VTLCNFGPCGYEYDDLDGEPVKLNCPKCGGSAWVSDSPEVCQYLAKCGARVWLSVESLPQIEGNLNGIFKGLVKK
jgi:hypothetical protein